MTFSETVRSRLDQLLDSFDVETGPGCAVGVVHDGQAIYSRGIGAANLEWESPISDRTRFHLASLSKHFAAYAIALLAQRGVVELDVPASTYLPQLPGLDARVTLKHLIHHTHGLPDQWELLKLAGWRMDDVITTEDVVGVLRDQHAVHSPPGAQYCYSNTGYTLLGLAVEGATGLSLREFCQREMFDPLGMKDTFFNDDYTEVAARRATSYGVESGAFKHLMLSFGTVGATSLISSVRDLTIWSSNLSSGRIGGAGVLAQLREVATLTSGRQTPYGFGLVFDAHRGEERIYHGGGDAGFTSMLIRFPALSLAVVVLSNTRVIPAPPLGDRIADLLLDELRVMPSRELEPLSDHTLSEYSGLFVHPGTALAIRLEKRDGALANVEHTRVTATKQIGTRRLALPRYTEVELSYDEVQTPSLNAWSYAGPELTYSLIKATAPSNPEDFAGRYRNESLNSECTIEVRAGQLWISRRKVSDALLTPTLPNCFDAIWGAQDSAVPYSLRFDRTGGRVGGFFHSFLRTHNIWFDRLPD